MLSGASCCGNHIFRKVCFRGIRMNLTPDGIKTGNVETAENLKNIAVKRKHDVRHIIAGKMSGEKQSAPSAPTVERFKVVAHRQPGEGDSVIARSGMRRFGIAGKNLLDGIFAGIVKKMFKFNRQCFGPWYAFCFRIKIPEPWFIGKNTGDGAAELLSDSLKIPFMSHFDEEPGRFRTKQVGTVRMICLFQGTAVFASFDLYCGKFRMLCDELSVDGSAGPAAFIIKPEFHFEPGGNADCPGNLLEPFIREVTGKSVGKRLRAEFFRHGMNEKTADSGVFQIFHLPADHSRIRLFVPHPEDKVAIRLHFSVFLHVLFLLSFFL